MRFLMKKAVKAKLHALGKRSSNEYLAFLDAAVEQMIEKHVRTIGGAKTMRAEDIVATAQFNAALSKRRGRLI